MKVRVNANFMSKMVKIIFLKICLPYFVEPYPKSIRVKFQKISNINDHGVANLEKADVHETAWYKIQAESNTAASDKLSMSKSACNRKCSVL